jgi:hypothetical protein
MSLGILFYSKTCGSCRHLMTLLSNQCLLDKFEHRCVDQMNDIQITSLGLKSVPTLVITSHQNGKSQILEGEYAFKWFQSIVDTRRQNIIKQTEQKRKLIHMASMKNNMKEGLYDYQQNECEGISDSYAYWKDDITKDIDAPQPKTFLPYKCDEQYGIMTIAENDFTKKKLNQDQQQILMKKLEEVRGGQDTHIKMNMEQQQINIVKSANNT